MLDLWIIRHGETDWNAERRIQGSSDIPLNGVGVSQARRLAPRLEALAFDQVFTSDLKRAYHTAELTFPGRPDIRADSRLREIDMGRFEGRQWDGLDPGERELLARWFAGPYHLPVPGGESNDDLMARARGWLEDLPQTGRVAAVAHGGTIASLLHCVVGRPEPRPLDAPGGWSFRFDNTSLTRLQLIDGPRHRQGGQ